ncbi:MAG: hypothetical protein JWN61_3051 [Pseudonocardiales bacterium]|nr:hypothetical protein [Pseudonocardiales bacterium]
MVGLTGTELLIGLVIVVGLVGIILPALPGSLLVLAAIGVWSFQQGSTTGWIVLVLAVALIGAATVIKFAWPGKNLKAAGIPTRTLVMGAALGVVGLFVVPVVGLPIGFVLGIYASEAQRLGSEAQARASTRAALRAVGLSILVELAGASGAAAIWLTAAILS